MFLRTLGTFQLLGETVQEGAVRGHGKAMDYRLVPMFGEGGYPALSPR